MGVLDPRLNSLLATRAHYAERVRKGELTPEDAPEAPERVGVLIKYTGDVADLKALGLEVGSVLGSPATAFSIATGTIALDRVEALAAVDHVVKVEMGRPLQNELDVSTVEIRAKPLHGGPNPLTGKRVVIGVIDDGLDYRHHAFRAAGGGTRILNIWDQSLTVRPKRPQDPFQEAAPPEFPSLGVEYTQAQIDQALHASKPLDVVRIFDNDRAHGTHVTGIAAGDGSQAGTRPGDHCTGANTYIGVAPEADIIFVRSRPQGSQLGESQNLVDAMRYIFTRAGQLDGGAGRPCVINISKGDNLGPHDGTSLVEQAIDLMLVLGTATRRAIVKSAGNEGDKRHHAMATVTAAGGKKTIAFSMPARAKRKQYMECWYDGAERLDVQLFAPGAPSPSSPVVHPGDPPRVWTVNPGAAAAQRVTVTITSALADPDNNDNRIFLEWSSGASARPPNGPWRIEFTSTSAGSAQLHCWLERGKRKVRAIFTSDVTTSHTISIPGTSANVITVGSYSAEELTSGSGKGTQKGDLAASSSRGPTRAGGRKPDITAPGISITAAKADSHAGCCCDCCYDFYVDKDGTSAAAPHVTGVIALMFQKNPNLDLTQITDALNGTARDPGDGSVLPNNDWGTGKVDATAAVNAVPAPPVPAGGGGGGGPGGGNPLPFLVAPTLDMRDRVLLRRLQRFQRWVLEFPTGHLYASLVSRHVDEVLRLINTNRRVATVWHRNGGPALVRAALTEESL